jgi:hypothetical protein
MEHLPFDIICRIADGDLEHDGMAGPVEHWKSCPLCQREVELQQSIIKVSRKLQLIGPSSNFSQNVLDTIIPSRKKRWYEWILLNMGNIISMTLVLAILGYVFSMTESGIYHNDKQTKVGSISEFLKIIQDGSRQLGTYLTPKFPVHAHNTVQSHSLIFALIAIILLVFIDKIAGHFLRHSKVNS